ncbi:MAG: polyribonucleotide nucleotidyltransferase [Candidatus Aminicenantes bacterium]|nr:polyribonucleotide nucleotidyltransferase [Candidatus Aminicenantes bacterium]
MPEIKTNLEINNRTLSLEIGRIGKQADGSGLFRYGDTVMFVSATSKKELKEPKPFLPLIVDYRENTYAAGKIPGGFFKREGKPSEREILISRLIDRPIRSLFPEGYTFDTQIIGFLLSADLENEPDFMGIVGASTALYCSDIPFTTPIGAVKVGYINNQFVINPTVNQLEESLLNMIVAGTEEGTVIVEAFCKEVEESLIMDGIAAARQDILRIIDAQKELYSNLNIQKRSFSVKEIDSQKYNEMESKLTAEIKESMEIPEKKKHDARLKEILDQQLAEIPPEEEEKIEEVKEIFFQLQKKIVRNMILHEGKRSDGRTFDEIRPIKAEVGILPRTHGSALFTRGETQCLATVTLGTFEDVQRLNGLNEGESKSFMLHYNFPPFSVGEVSFLRAPGRREIGHGALAERSILPSIPLDEENFPYTIRIVSDILESNGSSSMATVCGGVLALMDAGVPLSMIIAGIAIGLVKEGDQYKILTDIAGLEDHVGDMDLKVAGTEKGITAIQLDLKIPSLPDHILREGLEKARLARLSVLEKMKDALPEPRSKISPYAPRIINFFVNPEKVGDVIGPGGKIIKKIIAQTSTKIDIDETGKVTIASPDPESVEKAKKMITDLTAEAEIGKTYAGKVIRIEEYGAFVQILPNSIGLLHISEIAPYRIRNIRDAVKMGQDITVKVISIDDDNKVRVSRKALISGSSENSPPPDRHPRRKPPRYGKPDKNRY